MTTLDHTIDTHRSAAVTQRSALRMSSAMVARQPRHARASAHGRTYISIQYARTSATNQSGLP
eukprot:1630728-Prymnesium_polylepis.3